MTTMLAARAHRGATSVTLEKAEVPELDLLDKDLLEVDDLLTHRLPLAEVTEAISQVRGRRVPMRMAVVNP
jgi:hypothetical protein